MKIRLQQPRRWVGALVVTAAAAFSLGPACPARAHGSADRARDAAPLAAAGWGGRPIRNPLSRRGVPAGHGRNRLLRRGAGYGRPHGSARVRKLQRLLIRKGYRPGPVDGLFGPRTRASVQWFQIKHGLQPTGAIDLWTLRHMGRGAGARHSERPAGRARAAPDEKPSSAAAPVSGPAPAGSPAGGDGVLLSVLVAALGVCALAIAIAPRRHRRRVRQWPGYLRAVARARRRVGSLGTLGEAARRWVVGSPRTKGDAARRRVGAPGTKGDAARRRVSAPGTKGDAARRRVSAPGTKGNAARRRVSAPGTKGNAARRRPAAAGTPAAAARRAVAPSGTPDGAARRPVSALKTPTEQPRVVGYALATEARELERCAAAIRRACSDRGWTLACLIRDGGAAPRRPGLAYALDRVSKEVSPRLVIGRLDHVARSVRDVAALLAWCARLGVVLVVLDVGLDTSTREGRLLARRLLVAAGREAGRRATGSPRRIGRRTSRRPAGADRTQSDGA